MEDDKKMAQTVTQGSVTNGKAETMPILTGKRLLYHLWDQDQHLKSPEERKLVRELDFGILICATLGWVSCVHGNGPEKEYLC
jgi:ACS family pantothenate transporter-like MFS transporter